MTKDKRLQIRVSAEELDGISQRARAAGLSIAEYGRQRLLAGESTVVEQPLTLDNWDSFEGGQGLSYEAAAADDIVETSEDRASVREILEEHDLETPDWVPELDARVESIAAKYGQCDVEDVPAGVRCIKCGKLHA